jgi:cyclopropane fatty-acyl-phospholipid synthase-like methyltransferase
LQTYLPDPARVLEIASGTGEHAVYLSSNLSQVVHWQPTDIDPTALSSIEARRQSDHHPKLFPARLLDVTAPTEMPQGDYNTLLAINMIHIAPWQAAEGLMKLAQNLLSNDGVLFLYGPFCRPMSALPRATWHLMHHSANVTRSGVSAIWMRSLIWQKSKG